MVRMSRGGFSILELVLILAIIAVVAAIAAPLYASSLSNYRCEAAAQRIIRDLAVTRAETRSGSTNITVTLDLANNKLASLTSRPRPRANPASPTAPPP